MVGPSEIGFGNFHWATHSHIIKHVEFTKYDLDLEHYLNEEINLIIQEE